MYFGSFFFVLYFISILWSLTTGAISVDAKSTVRRVDGSVHVCSKKKQGKKLLKVCECLKILQSVLCRYIWMSCIICMLLWNRFFKLQVQWTSHRAHTTFCDYKSKYWQMEFVPRSTWLLKEMKLTFWLLCIMFYLMFLSSEFIFLHIFRRSGVFLVFLTYVPT